MPSFGDNLKREREKRNITLEQISQSTKIGTRMLQALEEERFNQLPGGIFNKGFVRAYARCLGLDEDQTVTDYLEASGELPPIAPEVPPPEQPLTRVEATTQVPQRQLPWGLFAALLLLAALALSLWSRRQQDREPVAGPASHPAAQQSVEQPQPSAAAVPVSSPASASASPASPSPPVAAPPVQPAPSSNPAGTVPANANPPEPAAATPAPGIFVVVIHARSTSWTSVTSDGSRVFSGVLHPGERRVIRARKEIVVKAGNAGGVELSFNGDELGAPGQDGEVRVITFDPKGLVSNIPPPEG